MNFRFFRFRKSVNPEILELLKNNIIGTPNYGMLYQHLGVDNKINKIVNPIYVTLERNGKVIGTCCFCSRVTENAGQNIPSFYIRYFSFKDLYRRQTIIDRISIGNSILRKEIRAILLGIGLEKNGTDKFFHYAYVDPRNIRSAMLCKEFGVEKVRKYTTVIFNRLNPKIDKRVLPINPSQESITRELLRTFYKDYNMFSFENLFNGRQYYIIKNDKDKIVAGASVNPDHWKIHSMPGTLGKVIMNTFSYLPLLNKIFNKDYKFLTIEGVYYSAGYENYLETLFETLLAIYDRNSAIICVDPDTTLYNVLKNLKLGVVDKLSKEVRGDVICKFINFSEEEKAQFKTKPAYISGIDVT